MTVNIEIEENNGTKHRHQEEHLGSEKHNLEPDVFQRTLEVHFRHFFGDDVVLCLCFVFVSEADAGAQTVGVYMDSLKNREWDGNDIAALLLLETGGKCREGYKAVRK